MENEIIRIELIKNEIIEFMRLIFKSELKLVYTFKIKGKR